MKICILLLTVCLTVVTSNRAMAGWTHSLDGSFDSGGHAGGGLFGDDSDEATTPAPTQEGKSNIDIPSALAGQAFYHEYRKSLITRKYKEHYTQITKADCSIRVTKTARTYGRDDTGVPKVTIFEVLANRGFNKEIINEKRVIATNEITFESLDRNDEIRDQIISTFKKYDICTTFGETVYRIAKQECYISNNGFFGRSMKCDDVEIE